MRIAVLILCLFLMIAFVPVVRSLESPTLLAPVDGTVVNDHTPGFVWELEELSHTILQIYTYNGSLVFSKVFKPGWDHYELMDDEALPSGTYYWHVGLVTWEGEPLEIWSNTWSFIVDEYPLSYFPYRVPITVTGVVTQGNLAYGIIPNSSFGLVNPSYATDENLSTYAWGVFPGLTDNIYIVVDLGGIYKGDAFCRASTNASNEKTFQYSTDNVNWTWLGDITANSSDTWTDISVTGITARYLGFWMNNTIGSAGTAWLREIRFDDGVSEEYRIPIEVRYDENMRPDFGDLRFTDEDGVTQLGYWVENYNLNENAKVWIRIQFPTGGDKLIYMYYGNPNVTSVSNLDSVFGDILVSTGFDSATGWTTLNCTIENSKAYFWPASTVYCYTDVYPATIDNFVYDFTWNSISGYDEHEWYDLGPGVSDTPKQPFSAWSNGVYVGYTKGYWADGSIYFWTVVNGSKTYDTIHYAYGGVTQYGTLTRSGDNFNLKIWENPNRLGTPVVDISRTVSGMPSLRYLYAAATKNVGYPANHTGWVDTILLSTAVPIYTDAVVEFGEEEELYPTGAPHDPIGDAFVTKQAKNMNFGQESYLMIGWGWANSFLKFQVPAGPIVLARLYLYAFDTEFHVVGARQFTNEWSEDTITWNNQLGYGALLDLRFVNSTGWWSWDVTSWVQNHAGGEVSLCLSGIPLYYQSYTKFYSREYQDESLHPYLSIYYQGQSTGNQNSLKSIVVSS